MANSSSNVSNSSFQEESRDVYEAALLLYNMKHLTLDPQAALELEQEKARQKYILQCSRPNYQDHLPPMQGLIGNYCSKPFQKQLTKSDLKKDQQRLLLNKSHVKQFLYPLLSSGEVKDVENREIEVHVYDAEGKVYEMKFKLWAEKAYVLKTNEWLRFCSEHGLVETKDWITIWMFKHATDTHQLCFAIIPNYNLLPSL